MKSFIKEFKEFALKGNVMMFAVGVIIGVAFQGVVTSFTDNIISPILGLFMGMNFDGLMFSAFGVTIKYGAFITSVINFIIMAFVVFLMVKGMNKLMSDDKGEADSPEGQETRLCPYCKNEIHAEATRCPACTSQLSI